MAYRFVQEAMTNAFRHAGATRIEASLRFEPRSGAPNLRDPALTGLVMRVADDGRGLNGEGEAGMGLAGMRDRVRLMGGSVKIESPQGGGVVVEAWFTGLRPNPDPGKLPDAVRNSISAKHLIIEITRGARRAYCEPVAQRAQSMPRISNSPRGGLATP